jgi:hypothetical protein
MLKAAMGCALFAVALAAPAWAQESQDAAEAQEPALRPHYGLLRMRDLTPFGFLRLDMRPAHAVSAPPKSWGVEVEIGYQNTWAMSPNVQQYLSSLSGRRRLGPTEIQAIRNLPGEAYLVDMELGLLDITFHYNLSDLLKTKYQVSVGLRYRAGDSVLTFAITENLGTFNNAPDIGLQLGWAYSPALGR